MSTELSTDLFNRTEASLAELPPVACPLVHLFTPGLYVREITIPAGTVVTTRVHKTEHPFAIMRGSVAVINGDEREVFHAPYMGVTMPGTRRMLYAITDLVWTTFHANPNDIEDADEMVEFLTDAPDNPHVDTSSPRFQGWRQENTPSLTYKRS